MEGAHYSCQMNLDFSGQIFEKCSDMKFHENSSSGSRVFPCGRAHVTNLIVGFRSFANVPSNIGPWIKKVGFISNISSTGLKRL